MQITLTLCMVLITTCGAATACVLYAVRENYNPLRNRLFLLSGVAVIVWAFGLAIAAAAKLEWVSVVGRRIAPLGWGSINALGLHFFLLLTGEDALIKRRWVYPALYLPAALIVVAHSVFPLFGVNPDVLVNKDYGWVNYSPLDFWDYLYFAYSALYVLIAFYVLRRWERRSDSENIKKQARILGYSMLLATLLGIASDVIPSFLDARIPQIAAIFMLILIFSSGYCIFRYSFMQHEAENQDEEILSQATRSHVYRYLGLVMALQAAVAYFGKKLLYLDPNVLLADFVPLVLLAAAIFLFLVNGMRVQEETKEMLVALSMSLLVPFFTLCYASFHAMTVWAVAFIIMLMCLLLNRNIILVPMIVVTLLTQLLQWACLPEADFEVSANVYILRMTIICLATMVAAYVNRVYTTRLRENASNARMQFILAEISHDFVGSGELNLDDKLHVMLGRCGNFLRCDHGYLILLDRSGENVHYTCEWQSADIRVRRKPIWDFVHEMLPRLMERLRKETPFAMRDAMRLPKQNPLRAELVARGIRAFVAVPIKRAGDETIGFMGFTGSTPMRKWNYAPPAFLEIVSGIVSDAVAIAESEQELSQMAYYDQLTGLPNRILFQERLEQAIRAAEAGGWKLGIAFLDLDSFKSVNDTMGHDQGDRFLAEAAHILSRATRARDMLARFGGDEFILLLNHIQSQEELSRIMDRIMEVIQKPIVMDGHEFFVSVSAGLALYPEDGREPEELIKHADTAMYSAKATGKGQYALCSQEMKDEASSRMRLTNLLYRALENNQFELYYQPQISLATEKIVGVEALIRWRLSDEELLEPGAFLPLAEQTGLIYQIGEWMLTTACAQNAAWHAQGHDRLRIAVNISAQQLVNPGFVALVQSTLGRTGLAPEFLELEITEDATSTNTDEVVEVLRRLRALGVTIAIDNFGTEYSSLSRLKLLTIDRIKMDMQFVQGIETNPKDQAIAKVIINLARSLNISVIAEGVETSAQRDFLRQQQCNEVQGFLYFRPMPAGEATNALAQ